MVVFQTFLSSKSLKLDLCHLISKTYLFYFIDTGDLKQSFDFVFLFTCRVINTLLGDIKTVEELFSHKYPEVFKIISLSDLEIISERVLIIIDGLDELQDIYNIHAVKKEEFHLKILSSIYRHKKWNFEKS